MSDHVIPVECLIVVDVQAAFVSGAGAVPAAERLVERTADLIARARADGALIVHLQNDGPAGAPDEPHTPGWELHHPVADGPAEFVIRKPKDDGFDGTPLDTVLTAAGVRALAVCGVMSEMCVQATARAALTRGYRVVLPHDAHATQDIPAAPGISEGIAAATVSRVAEWALSRAAEVVAHAADVTFTAPPAGDERRGVRAFSAHDGTALAYRVLGDGAPLICLPGGPQDSVYLGDLGGLSARRQLIMLDIRGTGSSAMPADPASCRCDRLVDDVEALREHLGLERVDLLAHSAGANLAELYVARHPERVGKLVLVAPSTRAVGIAITGETRRETARARAGEPWFPAAYAALEALGAGQFTEENWKAVAPFSYGRWDDAAQAHQAAEDGQRNDTVTEAFGAEGAFDPESTRPALAAFGSPVLLVAGEVDLGAPPVAVAEVAALFPDAELVVQPGSGHFPWLDDPRSFVATVAGFLG